VHKVHTKERQDDEMTSNRNNSNGNGTQAPVRRKRPHPARTARRAVGAAGVGGMLLMTGYMVVNSATTSAQTTSQTTGQSTSQSKTATAATPATVAQSTSKASH
jgi:hypothetical protein